jgi:uncharacterized protein YqgC (DUF456 family)
VAFETFLLRELLSVLLNQDEKPDRLRQPLIAVSGTPQAAGYNKAFCMEWILYLLLIALLFLGMVVTLMTLPGIWLMLAGTFAYAWMTHFTLIAKYTLLVLLALALLGEVLETLSAGAGARRAGGSRRGAWGALIGGILGGILLSIPLPFIGTLIGVCVGTCAGAIVGELSGGAPTLKSAAVGLGAAKGRFFGTLLKVGIAGVMFLIILWQGFPRHGG